MRLPRRPRRPSKPEPPAEPTPPPAIGRTATQSLDGLRGFEDLDIPSLPSLERPAVAMGSDPDLEARLRNRPSVPSLRLAATTAMAPAPAAPEPAPTHDTLPDVDPVDAELIAYLFDLD